MTTPRQSYNWKGAVFSFIRVLLVAVPSAIAPYFVADNPDGLDWRAIAIAATLAFLLTTANFFRDGETRFGTPPNPGRPDVVA